MIRRVFDRATMSVNWIVAPDRNERDGVLSDDEGRVVVNFFQQDLDDPLLLPPVPLPDGTRRARTAARARRAG